MNPLFRKFAAMLAAKSRQRMGQSAQAAKQLAERAAQSPRWPNATLGLAKSAGAKTVEMLRDLFGSAIGRHALRALEGWIGRSPGSSQQRAAAAAQEMLETIFQQAPEKVEENGPQLAPRLVAHPTLVPPENRPDISQRGGTITLRIFGRSYRVREDDPILTGEMIPVRSTNVDKIGFIYNWEKPEQGTLKVQFLDSVRGDGGKQKKQRGGPVYLYYKVHPALFFAFRRAASKGKFVWDRLRVRGTVSGHQYFYQLASLSDNRPNYVPRKATRIGPSEFYLRRGFELPNGKTIRSQLEDKRVRTIGTNRPVERTIANRNLPQGR